MGKCYLRHIKTGYTLLKQGDQDASLYFVVTGQLQVQQQMVGNEYEQVCHTVILLETVYLFDNVHPVTYHVTHIMLPGNYLLLKVRYSVSFYVEQRTLFSVHPGELVDPLAVLTGEPAFFTIRSRTDARVVVISKSDFYR